MLILKVKFTNSGDIIYAVALEQETDDGENYESAFKTFDASDYSSIGKICFANIFSTGDGDDNVSPICMLCKNQTQLKFNYSNN